MDKEKLRKQIWFICQDVRTEGLSETEATDKLLSLLPQAEPEQVLSEFINVIRGFNTVLVGDKGILEAYEGFLEVQGVKRKDGTPEQIETQGWIKSILDPSPDLVEQVAKIIDKALMADIVDGRFGSKPYAKEIISLIRPSIEQEVRGFTAEEVSSMYLEGLNRGEQEARAKEWQLCQEHISTLEGLHEKEIEEARKKERGAIFKKLNLVLNKNDSHAWLKDKILKSLSKEVGE